MKVILIGLAILASVCAQVPSAEYLPPGADYGGATSNIIESNFLDSEPSYTLADDGYRYRTVRRFRLRHRRDVNELSSGYLPPQASAPEPAYSVPVSYENSGAYSAPAPIYTAPASTYDTSYEVAASEPAHTIAADGYRYKTVKRYRLRHRRRRDVSELSSGYLPPQASALEPVYSVPASYESVGTYSSPAPAYDASYEVVASEPAYTVAADGYRYKTVKRYRLRQRHRRDVSELSSGYLPPQASAPEPVYSAPSSYESVGAYSSPAPAYDASYEVAASEPAHALAADGYRYKTVKRYRLRQRRRRDVSELSSGYLPPQASGLEPVYSAPASYESVGAYSAPAPVYSVPVQNYEQGYDVAASAPAHTLAYDGYRYRTIKRHRYRHRN